MFNLYSWETAKKTESIRSNIIQETNEIREEIGICVSYSIANLSQVGQHSAVWKYTFKQLLLSYSTVYKDNHTQLLCT